MDDSFLKIHFAGKNLFGLRAERVDEREEHAELCILRLNQLFIYIFPFLAIWFVFFAGEVGTCLLYTSDAADD